MKWIVDASVAVKWLVEEEDSDLAVTISTAELVAPDLLLTECANVLWVKTRRGEIEPAEARERLELLETAPVRWVPPAKLIEEALSLALELEHPVYDCLYLALSIRESSPVVTADRRFVAAVRNHESHASQIVLLAELGESI